MTYSEDTAGVQNRSAPIATADSPALVLPVFAATIFLSAFLLFSVQPFFAKMVLPRLGGSPAVWSVAMVFFQSVLLAGYAYAHFLTKRLTPGAAAVVHLAVIAFAFLFLPIAIPDGWNEPPQTNQAFWLLGLFGVAVGVPFFAVSANGPLLQAWFARTGHPHASDPYFLYGSSNIGSFASLILYIVAFEPLMTVTAQSFAWMAGFAILGGAIAVCALYSFRGAVAVAPVAQRHQAGTAGWREKLIWMGLAAVPSGLLVAVTAHISVDIAAAPFLWVIPLALFLLTFVLAFARKPVFSIDLLSSLVAVLAALVFVTFVMGHFIPIGAMLAAHLAFFFFAALLAHSVLVSRRPAASELTGFYLWMSLGGVVGGAVTTLLSPWIFNWVAEYPVLILAALFLRPQLYSAPRQEVRVFLLIGLLVATIINNPLVEAFVMPKDIGFYALAIAAFGVAAAVIRLRSEALHIFFAILIVGFSFAMQGAYSNLFVERSFFGVVRAFPADDGKFAIMAHGTTEHGAMRLGDGAAKPVPIAYYHESGGIAAALFAAQEKIAGRPAQIGAVGLGVGAMLCHRKPGETWTFFEIDRSVVSVASDPNVFRFVPECGNGDPIVLGDARLTLAKEPDGKFDYLLIDAFSSDSIPVHLLTAEAIELYGSKLAPGGILAIHISNRYMELESVISALAKRTGMTGRFGKFLPPEPLREGQHVNPSQVAVLARAEADLGAILADERWKPLDSGSTAVWTDDYSNILAAIWRGLRN
jgi:hypothetical protein